MVAVRPVSYKVPSLKCTKHEEQKRLKKFLGKLEYIVYKNVKYLVVTLRGNLTLVPPNHFLLFVGDKTLIDIMPYDEIGHKMFVHEEDILKIENEAKERGISPGEYLESLKKEKDK